jgi:hypothetical protein
MLMKLCDNRLFYAPSAQRPSVRLLETGGWKRAAKFGKGGGPGQRTRAGGVDLKFFVSEPASWLYFEGERGTSRRAYKKPS